VRVAVYLGSSAGRAGPFTAAAAQAGRLLAEAGIGIVYGGASVGLMGDLADAALAAGGEVIGVIPAGLFAAEVAHQGLTRLETVRTMHDRKARMAGLADAFVALPGGLGTLDELIEILTWQQLGLHDKPVALVNVGGFWDRLLGLIDQLVADGFVPAGSRQRLILATGPAELVPALRLAVRRPAAGRGPQSPDPARSPGG
jgi:uncharacterized protein (TIGR00730 family)